MTARDMGICAPATPRLLRLRDALRHLGMDRNRFNAEVRPSALLAVNTGCRDGEICRLRWDWEEELPGLYTSVFVIPDRYVKNGDDRLVVLNRIAGSVIDAQRGQHPEFVFVYRGKPIDRMLNSAWQRARVRAGLPQVRVHDLKHTFGRRLRGRRELRGP